MIWTIDFTTEFSRGAKVLKKRYKSFMDDLEDFKDSIMKNPFQGAELVPGIRKVRMTIESKGKKKPYNQKGLEKFSLINREGIHYVKFASDPIQPNLQCRPPFLQGFGR
jgi:hypothetical protein